MVKTYVIVLVLLALAGCLAPAEPPELTSTRLDQINQQVIRTEKSLAGQIARNCQQDHRELAEEIALLVMESNQRSIDVLPGSPEFLEQCENHHKADPGSGKLILGEVEAVYLLKEKTSLDARIDTGAETSSLGVYKLARFERDGEKWVRFSLSERDKAPVYRYPIHDSVRIKQESDETAERRREIKIDISIGGKKYRKQVFNLADRSHLQYQVLIGRSFLRDIAMVDVSGRNLLERE